MAGQTELEMLVEAATLERASLDTKEAWCADPSDDTRAAFVAAKNANRANKAFWRGIREAVGVGLTEGSAVAAPAMHGMGVAAQEQD